MALRRRRPRTTRKRPARRSGGTTSRRRYPTTRRRYPRKMSNKRILNLTARKKRDTMQSFTNLSAAGGTATFAAQPAFLYGGRTYILPWIATARDLSSNVNAPNTIAQESARTATVCYMRGLKERIQIQTSSGIPWQWRRICFTVKGNDLLIGVNGDGDRQPLKETTFGFMRNVVDWNDKASAAIPLTEALFKGQRNTDWRSLLNAPVDTRRVTLKYDKTRIISSGNSNGVLRNFNLWHPMNKNLVYGDDEGGNYDVEY
ncbi:putative coat protein [Bemisia-associated genomovirus AdO]|uniref:Putative coat protein n=1 Tax=Bemisia-associated genomovirus AdO TaxID=1986478 RepID=A0A1Z2X292_9VIRU|nr:putative coat protein [Bemisia-associated genomovirus AdO]ASB32514.1 putative coat protein [Bemisia-associated genomovirus AdO]